MDTTFDGLLNRRVLLEQPAKGYRVAVDTVLLAAAVPAQSGQRLLDMGCGVGGAMLCLAARMPGLSIAGVEIQPELAELCRRNIAHNNFDAKMDVIVSDITKILDEAERKSPPPLAGGVRGGGGTLSQGFSYKNRTQGLPMAPPPILPREGGGTPWSLVAPFDHVLMNPPYHDEARHDVSDNEGKRIANTEKDGDLALWLGAAARALARAGSTVTIIHRADREAEILSLMAASFGRVEILPLIPRLGGNPRRILVRGRKRVDGQEDAVRNIRCKPLILHDEALGYTAEVEEILRHAKPMDFIAEMT